MRVDLHMHSTASDGAVDSRDVVGHAVRGKLDVIALTDHDTTAGVPAALAAALDRPIDLITGIEVTSTHEGREIHVLGYYVDVDAPELIRHAEYAGGMRQERMREMIRRLVSQGVDVSFEDVLEAAGPERGSIGRPHLARALVTGGYVPTVKEAFNQYISDDHAAFVPTEMLSPVGAVELILAAGGVAVWAHPPKDMLEVLVDELVDAGLDGLETYRPKHSASYVLELEALGRDHGLLKTGGSDWHGPQDGSLGGFHVSGDEIALFLERGGR